MSKGSEPFSDPDRQAWDADPAKLNVSDRIQVRNTSYDSMHFTWVGNGMAGRQLEASRHLDFLLMHNKKVVY